MPPDLRRGSLAGSVGGAETPAAAPDGASNSPSPGSSTNTQQSPTTPAGLAPKPIRRRMRMITSCLECRRRKLKCNKSQPCTNCLKFSRDCLYIGPKLDEASQLKLTEIKEKVGSLERQLERDVAKSTGRGAAAGATGGGNQQRILADDVEDEFEGERDLEITPMVALDLTYEDDVEGTGTDDLIDLGIRVGRMRITERIGGLNRPRISEEILAGITDPRQGENACLQQQGLSNTAHDGMLDSNMDQDTVLPDFLRPGASYIAPTGGFFFGQVIQSPSILEFLPSEHDGDRLIHRYFEAVHPIARCVHRALFEALYDTFREDVRRWFEPRASTQAVVFAALFSAAVSLDEGDVEKEYGVTKSVLVTRMKLGTESALSKADFLRTTKVETLQAFVMFLLPLCREEVSRAHSVLVGAAVRMAECMGLHRDGDAYGLSPLETHVRRLIWHQLCFLDIRTCEAQGPKPAIRREDYDTKLPLNCEEDELAVLGSEGSGPQPAEHWTSTLFSVMRFEVNEMMRIIWSDRRKLEARRMTLTTVLTKIENFRKRMAEKYNHFLDEKVPIQMYARLVMQLLTYRLHAMVLHPYHSNTSNPMPERLNTALVVSGVNIIETAIQLERNPFFRQWRWYMGAYQQFQIALLLATEIYYRPASLSANRIWACLDYVFNLDPNMPREQKSRHTLTEIMDKTSIYMGMRRMRAPTAITRAVPDKQAVKDSPPSQEISLPATARTSHNQHHPQHNQDQNHQYHHRQQSQQQQMQQGPPPALYQQPIAMHQQQLPRQGMKAEPGNQQQNQQKIMSTTSGASSSGGPVGMGLASDMMCGMHPPPQPQQHNQNMMMTMPNIAMAMPTQEMVFGGVSNGEVLWCLPPGNNPGSPENSSEGGSPENTTHSQRLGPHAAAAANAQQGLNAMEGVDWVSIMFFGYVVMQILTNADRTGPDGFLPP